MNSATVYTHERNVTEQTRLFDLGWYGLRVDGIVGDGHLAALTNFKRAEGLRPRPMPGPITMTRLWSDDAARAAATPVPSVTNDDPPNLVVARQLLGLQEAPGPANNPDIVAMAEALDQPYAGDHVPWCGLFVAHCNAIGYPDVPQSFNRLSARAWKQWARDLGEVSPPPLGSVCRLWREDRNGWKGHVFLVTAWDPRTGDVCGIGGNQSNKVSEQWFPHQRVLGFSATPDMTAPAPQRSVGTYSASEA